ncbi:hypothetical protein ANCCAN_17721, partial [Ancylostoma caninum]
KYPNIEPTHINIFYSISEAGKATPKRSRRGSGNPRSPPVLNVIWEPTQGIYAAEGPGEKESHIADHRQLISSTPIILKKPAPSGGGHIDEVSAQTPATPKAVPAETANTSAVVSNDVAPSVSVTTTTTRTRVSEPSPGYTKKVTQTFTTTKEVKRTPQAQDKLEAKSPALLTAKEMLKEVGEKPAASSALEGGQKE